MTNQPERRYRWQLVGLALAMLLPSLGTSIANIALPTLAKALGNPFAEVQWVVLAYLLAMTVLVVSAGRLGDLVGRRRLLLVGIAIFTLASAACAISSNLWLLVAARGAQGCGAAIMMALTTALAADVVPKDKIGRAMGLLGTMSAVGTALGPSLGGLLIESFGWQAIFAILVPAGAATLVLCAVAIPALPAAASVSSKQFDVLGTLLLAGSLSAYAMSMTAGPGSFGLLNGILLATALLGFATFAYSQFRVPAPLIQPAVLGNASLRSGLISTALISTVTMTTMVVGPFFLSDVLQLPPAHIGLAMSVGPMLAALAGVPSGRLVDRFGARLVVLAGLAATAAGCLIIGLLATSLSAIGYVAAIGVVTIGYALFQAANNTAILTGVPPDQRGVISGLMSLSRNLGLITGASLMGTLFASLSGAHGHTTSAATGTTFVVSAGLAVLAICLAANPRKSAE